MSDLKNFESTAQKEHFYKILKNLFRDFAFVGLVVFGAMWLMGIVGNTKHHFACNAEQVAKKDRIDFFYQDGNYFSNGGLQSQDFAFEGKSSLKLSGENAFGFAMDYEYLVGNEEVTTWVWRYAEGDWKSDGRIVISIDGKLWKAATEVLETRESGWEKIQISFPIPNNCKNEILHIYCWNPGKRPIYFDDFHVVVEEKEAL